MEEDLLKKSKDFHSTKWHKLAGVSSCLPVVLPIINEFESIPEELILAIGGTGMVSVMAVVGKIGHCASFMQTITEEQSNQKEEFVKQERKRIKHKRKRRKDSKYCDDPIGWSDEEGQ